MIIDRSNLKRINYSKKTRRLDFKNVMTKYNLKNDTMIESSVQRFVNIQYNLEIPKKISTEDL